MTDTFDIFIEWISLVKDGMGPMDESDCFASLIGVESSIITFFLTGSTSGFDLLVETTVVCLAS
jgi:hypothetical protein